jgi:multidrug efflux pump subunit AcrB
MRTVNADRGERVPTLRFALDQDRFQSIGLSSSEVARQHQVLLIGIPITEVREDIRPVQVASPASPVNTGWGERAPQSCASRRREAAKCSGG